VKPKLNFDILESLRGLAALYVCIGHCRGVLWIGGEHYLKLHPRDTLTFSDYLVLGLNMLTRLNSEFVIVFFVLSGFSIAHSLRNNKQVLPFYKRRFVRLYPPYVAALVWAMLIVGGIQLLLPHFSDGTFQTPTFDRLRDSRGLFEAGGIARNLFYMPQLGGVLTPFWSLTQEVIFYILAPFLLRNKKVYYALSILLFLAANVLNYYQWPQTIITNYFFFNIFFAIGIALYDNFEQVCQKTKAVFTKYKTIGIVVLIYFTMIGISLTGHETINALMAALLSVILIIYLLSKNIRIKWLIGIGRFSYTLYITHFSTIFLYLSLYYGITKAAPPYIFNNLLFIPCVFLCLGVAFLQKNLVEKRSKMILDKLRRKNVREEPKTEQPVLAS
jgi:peptidoglycan/LPS O-acetylase OafA/YrhL